MDKMLSARELSFTAKTVRVYLDPLHIFHTMRVVMPRPDRLMAPTICLGWQVTG